MTVKTTTPGLPETTAFDDEDRTFVDHTTDNGTSYITNFFRWSLVRPRFDKSAKLNSDVGVAGTARTVASSSGPWTPNAQEGQYVDITGSTANFVVNAPAADTVVLCRVPAAVSVSINLTAYGKVVGTPAGSGNSVLQLVNIAGETRAVWVE